MVVEWTATHLPLQGTWVRSLVWEGFTRCRATKRERHTTEPELHSPQEAAPKP